MLCLYDVTTLYFETVNADGFRKPGFSNDLGSRRSNIRNRLKAAGFPVTKTLETFDVAASSIPADTFAYLISLE